MRTVVIIGLLLLASCQVTRQRSTSVKARGQLEQNESINTFQQSNEREIDFGRETVTRIGSGTFLEIVPRGSFRIRPDGTFDGEAEIVRSFRRDTTEFYGVEYSAVRESSDASGTNEERQLSSIEEFELDEARETRRRPRWLSVLAGLAVAALVIWAIRSFYKRIRIWP